MTCGQQRILAVSLALLRRSRSRGKRVRVSLFRYIPFPRFGLLSTLGTTDRFFPFFSSALLRKEVVVGEWVYIVIYTHTTTHTHLQDLFTIYSWRIRFVAIAVSLVQADHSSFVSFAGEWVYIFQYTHIHFHDWFTIYSWAELAVSSPLQVQLAVASPLQVLQNSLIQRRQIRS